MNAAARRAEACGFGPQHLPSARASMVQLASFLAVATFARQRLPDFASSGSHSAAQGAARSERAGVRGFGSTDGDTTPGRARGKRNA